MLSLSLSALLCMSFYTAWIQSCHTSRRTATIVDYPSRAPNESWFYWLAVCALIQRTVVEDLPAHDCKIDIGLEQFSRVAGQRIMIEHD